MGHGKPLGARPMPGSNLYVIDEKSFDKLKMLVFLPQQIEFLRTQFVMAIEDPKRKTRDFVFKGNEEVQRLLGCLESATATPPAA